MERCIKCGREIPDGELFCLDCSMNPGGSSGQKGKPAAPAAAGGQMQMPKATRTQTAAKPPRSKKSRSGMKTALVLVSLMLAATLAFLFWQYDSLRRERTSLDARQAAMQIKEQENEELQAQVEELLQEQQRLQEDLEEKEQELKALNNQLSGSQNSQTQSAFDLSNAQAELQRLEEENQQLLLLEQDLEKEIDRLTTALTAAQGFQTKAEFMDKYVVFGNNNNTGYYHTYDCQKFVKTNFWAYSRTLAESSGFKPCPDCGGKP